MTIRVDLLPTERRHKGIKKPKFTKKKLLLFPLFILTPFLATGLFLLGWPTLYCLYKLGQKSGSTNDEYFMLLTTLYLSYMIFGLLYATKMFEQIPELYWWVPFSSGLFILGVFIWSAFEEQYEKFAK